MIARYLLRRAVRAAATMGLVLVITFVVMRLSGDPTYNIITDDIDPLIIDAYRAMWGLDQPLHIQFVRYLSNVAQGDFGASFRDGTDALAIVLARVPGTALLMGWSIAVMVALGAVLGPIAAFQHGRAVERVIMALSLVAFATPNFFLGIVAILVFGLWWGVLPTSGSGTWRHLVLPVLTIGLSGAPVYVRMLRSSILATLRETYVTAALSRGYPPLQVFTRHVLPNAFVPSLTLIAMSIGVAISGAVVVESVFAWPGVGRLFTGAIAYRDMPVLQVIVILIAASVALSHLVFDAIAIAIDPRIARHE